MIKRIINNKFWTGFPSWILIGAFVVLLPIFAFMTVQNIQRWDTYNTRLLLEKGTALIRSFGAGARTGIMGDYIGSFHLHNLLTEIAMQPYVSYILITDTEKTIVAHNNPDYEGETYKTDIDLKKVYLTNEIRWHILKGPDKIKIFEVYKRFTPVGGIYGEGMMRKFFNPRYDIKNPRQSELIIFVGLDMTSAEQSRIADTKHYIFTGIVLLLIGFAGVVLLFMTQSYRSTRDSLSRIKVFSDHLVENMPIGLIAVDGNRKIASFNSAAGSILSLPFPEVIGKKIKEVLPEGLLNLITGAQNQSGAAEINIDCVLNNGRIIPLEVGVSILKDENANFIGHIILFKDLSEVQSLRREVARSQRLASLGSLAAGIAHEIRNPLSSIKGLATYFIEHNEKEEDKDIAKIMIQEVDRLNRVVSQLVELARPVSISKKPAPLKSVIEDSIKLLKREALEKNIKITIHIPPEEIQIALDKDRITQVLLNLYLNAIESMEKGGRLSVDVSKKDKGAIIKVSDTGSGIKKEDLALVFDPYFTTKSTGTGLGLAIVYNIIEAHGGKITVQSRPGQETVFTIFLPHAKHKE
ncbi:ATP-binding protein [Desulfobacterium sp. N47]|uniref:ATP-binding protein n=1 Tax=Desulfobacterium sp. N47 TaxID=3115210 RepID=UPI003C9D6521